jgi:hypothetical protein
MNLKKIFHGFNMMGNRISAVTVDEPTAAAHPVPLDYLQESQTYDTAAAVAQEDSPIMPWVTQAQNQSIKPLLDKILFPIVNPIWAEPIFQDVKLTVIGEYFIQSGVHLLFESVQKTMRLDYSIAPGDRTSGVTALLTVTKNDLTTQVFNSTTTSDTNGTINFTFSFENILSMVISKVWVPSSAVKNDNYGNPYKPSEFNSNYTSTFDAFDLLEETNVVSPPMIYKALSDEIGYDTGLSSTTAYSALSSWSKDKRFFLQPGGNLFVVLIPTELYDNCLIYAIYGNENQPIEKAFLIPSVSGLTDITVPYFGSNVAYKVCTIDFGYFAAQTNLDFQFIANTDNA